LVTGSTRGPLVWVIGAERRAARVYRADGATTIDDGRSMEGCFRSRRLVAPLG
jgi:hypothetical protein